MMRPVILKAALFRDHGDDPKEHERSRVSMLFLLQWLVMHDRLWLRMYPDTPKIYDSGVKYIYKDADEAPVWQDVSYCLAKKTGDCKDFAAWRCAELLEDGVMCRPVIQWRKVGDAYRFHALVIYPDGTLEDPSKLLGMQSDTSFITPPSFDDSEEDENMNPSKTAEAVVRGLFLGNDDTKKRAKDTYDKLCEMAQSDTDSAKSISAIKRCCAFIRSQIKTGEEDTLGLVEAALNPSKRKSILIPDNIRGNTFYEGGLDAVLGLSDEEQKEISTPTQAVLSVIPFTSFLAPLTPLAVKGADDLITKAQGGDKQALGKIADAKARADQGDPQAKKDIDALKRVKAAKDGASNAMLSQLAPKTWWPGDLYRAGVGPTLH